MAKKHEIDEAKGFLTDPKSMPADKKAWAKLLGDMLAIPKSLRIPERRKIEKMI